MLTFVRGVHRDTELMNVDISEAQRWPSGLDTAGTVAGLGWDQLLKRLHYDVQTLLLAVSFSLLLASGLVSPG